MLSAPSPSTDLESSRSSVFRQLINGLSAVVLPTACSICGGELAASWVNICGECWDQLEPWVGPACARCGIPFTSEWAVPHGSDVEASLGLCSPCRKGENGFDLARSFGVYRGHLRAAILQLKFHRRERLGLRLGQLLTSAWDAAESTFGEDCAGAESPILAPVPLHASRERVRGFNQAELLAHGLAKALAGDVSRAARMSWLLPFGLSGKKGQSGARAPRVVTRCLRRARATAPQSGLTLSARRENVRGVFQVVRPELVRDRAIVLVDDVMTTGATVSACAAALKRAGARCVVALTLARATPLFPDIALPPAKQFEAAAD